MTSNPFHKKDFSKRESTDYSEIEIILRQNFDPQSYNRVISFFDEIHYANAAEGIIELRKNPVEVKTPKGNVSETASIPEMGAALLKQDNRNIFFAYEGPLKLGHQIRDIIGEKSHPKAGVLARLTLIATGTALGYAVSPFLAGDANGVLDPAYQEALRNPDGFNAAFGVIGTILGSAAWFGLSDLIDTTKWKRMPKKLEEISRNQIYFQDDAAKFIDRKVMEGFEAYKQDVALEQMEAIYEGKDFEELEDAFLQGGLEELTAFAVEKEMKPAIIKNLRQAANPQMPETQADYFRQIGF